MKITFQGEWGAFSHEALQSYFAPTDHFIPCPFSENAIEQLLKKEVDAVFLPVENSIAGNVSHNMRLINQNNLTVQKEYYHPIHHCLLASPKATLEEIEYVSSHPIALSQCLNFIKEQCLKTIEGYDTAGAAKEIAAKNDPRYAAIGSKMNAEVYDLKIIKKNIQSQSKNITRFFLVSKKEPPSYNAEKTYKTSIAFTLPHKTGSLIKALEVFSYHKINLTRLVSEPLPHDVFNYLFFADFIGHYQESLCSRVLEDLRLRCKDINLLGSYPLGENQNGPK